MSERFLVRNVRRTSGDDGQSGGFVVSLRDLSDGRASAFLVVYRRTSGVSLVMRSYGAGDDAAEFVKTDPELRQLFAQTLFEQRRRPPAWTGRE